MAAGFLLAVQTVAASPAGTLGPGTAAPGTALAPPDAAIAAQAAAALASIEAEIARLAPPEPAPPSWRATADLMPLAALDEAAHTLAALRVRAGLELDASGRTPLDAEAVRSWFDAFQAGLRQDAARLVEASAAAPVPRPGPELEAQLLAWLPAYRVEARGGQVAALAARAAAAEGVGALADEAAALEAFRVLWEHRPPAPAAPGNASLTLKDVQKVRDRALSLVPGALSGTTAESGFVLESRLRAMREVSDGRAFAALAFTLVTEEAAIEANATANAAVRRLDLRPPLAAERAGLVAPPSPLLRHAEEAAAAALANASASPEAVLAQAPRYAAAIAEYGVLRTLRGEARLPDLAVPLPEPSGAAPAASAPMAPPAAVAAVLAAVALRRRTGFRS